MGNCLGKWAWPSGCQCRRVRMAWRLPYGKEAPRLSTGSCQPCPDLFRVCSLLRSVLHWKSLHLIPIPSQVSWQLFAVCVLVWDMIRSFWWWGPCFSSASLWRNRLYCPRDTLEMRTLWEWGGWVHLLGMQVLYLLWLSLLVLFPSSPVLFLLCGHFLSLVKWQDKGPMAPWWMGFLSRKWDKWLSSVRKETILEGCWGLS
jgi:hypothetical protein